MSEDGDGEMLVQNAMHQTGDTMFVCGGIGLCPPPVVVKISKTKKLEARAGHVREENQISLLSLSQTMRASIQKELCHVKALPAREFRRNYVT